MGDDVASGRLDAVAEGQAGPLGTRPLGIGKRPGNLFGAGHDLVKAAVAIFAADNPVALSHHFLLHSAATVSLTCAPTNCAASVDSLRATVETSPPEIADAIASK